MKPIFILLGLSLALSTSLFSQQRELGVTFSHKFNGNDLVVGSSTFPIWNGKMVWIKRAEFYLSGIGVKDENGVETTFPDTYQLVRAQEVSRRIVLGNIASTPISHLFMSVGVDTTKNHDDPTLYPETHPLGLKEPSMHWGWAGGYRFLVVEGKVDNSGDGIPETDFEYHNLGDELYKQTDMTIAPAYDTGSDLTLSIVLDYARLFDQNTMLGNQIVHGSSAKNLAMINNAVNNHFFSFAPKTAVSDVQPLAWSVGCVQNELLINTPVSEDATLSLTDLKGNVIATKKADASGITYFSVQDLPTGLWMVTLKSATYTNTQKVMIVQ